ncbi:GLPGLI family protein [Flavobacteriaceae bacterium F89]|uniref:GLPGLI family protein n=1 Tax=Cerina litoralis TaxID=2874477 RepID=A0AAE3ESY0_9FLAO|nr:GLPGLI family protein [Cerina litoralis]MCG2460572.1 GLPGLI family protein [Cerina litoralis]
MRDFIIFGLLFVGLTKLVHAQDFQGEATYFSKTSVRIDLSGRNIPEDRKQQMLKRMKEANERTYTFDFDRTSSIYKEEEKLEQPGNDSGGRRFGMMGATGGDYYKNIPEGTYISKNDLFGKIFLVQDSLPKMEWKLGDETKKIGNYTVYKATATKSIKRPNMGAMFRRGSDDDKNKGDEFTEKQVEITAWYAPEIPVNQGPGDYWGLPGLILEVNDDITTILCTKIVLNPKERIEIKAPQKGKVVTQAEYDEISKEKMKEMRENFRSRGGNRGGGRRP